MIRVARIIAADQRDLCKEILLCNIFMILIDRHCYVSYGSEFSHHYARLFVLKLFSYYLFSVISFNEVLVLKSILGDLYCSLKSKSLDIRKLYVDQPQVPVEPVFDLCAYLF